jgi:hypothetical protein
MKEDLVNDLEKEKVDSQLFERVMKINQKDVFCIEMKKIINDKRHFYEK